MSGWTYWLGQRQSTHMKPWKRNWWYSGRACVSPCWSKKWCQTLKIELHKLRWIVSDGKATLMVTSAPEQNTRFLVSVSGRFACRRRWAMVQSNQKTKLTMLDNAQHFYKMQKNLQTQHQLTIDNWFDSYTKLHSGYTVSKITWSDNSTKHTGHTSDSIAEFKFAWSPGRQNRKTGSRGLRASQDNNAERE